MYLKKIELFGFKSFAHKTEIVFEPGITCIVGPNGCGKSNISDAIRWVLGERSAKLLRGAKMEDVIFAGTDFKKPVHFAEVSLTIDNSDHKMPIHYEEVVLTRRLDRSGESQYFINRTPCRLKDVQDIILDTGLGSNDYSMIGQGRIEHILSAEAEERRHLIEEAAGISKYKVKKEEALRKLERTEQNLLRLNDIMSEVERNIRYAERQAKRAEHYKTQLEELKALELKKVFFDCAGFYLKIKSLTDEAGIHREELGRLEQESAKQNESVRELESRLNLMERNYFEEETKLSEAKQKLNLIETNERFSSEKIETLKLARQKALGSIESLEKNSTELNAQFEEKTTEREELTALITELEAKREEKEAECADCSKLSPVPEEDLKRVQESSFILAREISELKNLLSEIRLKTIALEHQTANAAKTEFKLKEEQAQLAERLAKAREEKARFTREHAAETTRIQNAEVKCHDLERRATSMKTELATLKEKRQKLENQYVVLNELDESIGPDPKQIIERYKNRFAKDHHLSSLIDLIEIEAGYEAAVEAVLSDRLRGIVAEDMTAAVNLLHDFKEAGAQGGTIFIRERMNGNGSSKKEDVHPKIDKRLADAVRVKKGYESLLEHILGHVFVVDEITHENALELSKLSHSKMLVSKSGVILGPEFQIAVRNLKHTQKGALSRHTEKERLTREIARLDSEEQTLTQNYSGLEQQLAELQTHEKTSREETSEQKGNLERLYGVISGIDERYLKISEELDFIVSEKNQFSSEIKLCRSEEEKKSTGLVSKEKELAQADARLKTYHTHKESKQKEKEALAHELEQISNQLGLQQEREEDLNEAIQFLTRQLDDVKTQIMGLSADREEGAKQVETLVKELEQFAREKEVCRAAVLERSVTSETIKKERLRLTGERSEQIEKSQNIVRSLELIKQKLHELSLREMELNYQKSSLIQDLETRYQIQLNTLDPALYGLEERDYAESAAKIERLREKMTALGNVNLLAISEYEELKERHNFFITQKNDLVEARESLLETIRKINRTTKKLFDDTLTKVREAFQEYFRLLFKGGQADLILLDEINPLESGLDILARPPGKKLQHISLLSGGEKALTAIALLFALFSVRPSPFCVLDEVDAPLDEANTDRFLGVLEHFLQTTQFIIVTHCRKTIAMGDTLYGVTMEEPGISKIVSVKLGHDQAIEHESSAVKTQLNQVLT